MEAVAGKRHCHFSNELKLSNCMQVKIDKQYAVPASMDAAWKVLSDMRELASCMPGAEITEQVDPTHYKGNMKLKVGPASAVFGGDIEVLELDEQAKRIRFKGKGAERSGSTAAMDLTATLQPGDSAGTCALQGNAELTVSGKFAQFGGRMMTAVADSMLERFTQSFSQKAAAVSVPLSPSDMPQATAQPVQTSTMATEPVRPVKVTAELNALSLVWDAIKRFVASLMHTRK
jgi:uncharacterized protein